LLFSVAAGSVTVTNPVVAPAGTVAEIKVLDTTVNGATLFFVFHLPFLIGSLPD